MLATFAFLAFWVAIALALFLLAMRGGPRARRAAHRSEGRAAWRIGGLAFAVFAALAGAGLPLALTLGNRDDAVARVGGTSIRLTAQEERGRELFGDQCARCHALAAARASGPIGPNLDQLRPPAALVYDAVVRGRQRGGGTMPSGLLDGEDARAVAAFVAATAGR